eukprot:scaffold50675_cov40-Tisochrysis_lutea.AAC.1
MVDKSPVRDGVRVWRLEHCSARERGTDIARSFVPGLVHVHLDVECVGRDRQASEPEQLYLRGAAAGPGGEQHFSRKAQEATTEKPLSST